MNSISGQEQEMEPGDRIEQLIKDARDKSLGDRQRKEKEIEDRRMAAMKQIAEAAIRHKISDETLERRIRDASTVRISQTEAYAILAEQGDFSSQIMWWDIRVGERQTLWKGYVIRKRSFRKFIEEGSHTIEVNTRPIVDSDKGWVSECFCDGGKVVAVGISQESIKDSVVASVQALRSAVAPERHEGIRLVFWELFTNPEQFMFQDGLTQEGD
jgi:hypothetical protein